MYRVGHRPRNHKRRAFLITLSAFIAISVLTYGVSYARTLLHPATTISQGTAVTTKVVAASQPDRTYSESDFNVALPVSWEPTTRETTPYNVYRWQDTSDKNDARLLEIYQDTIPQNFAVNRALAVTANGTQVSVVGNVSDNCIDFTKTDETASSSTGVHAKWQGIDFLCDINNYERNVVGTISSNGVNSVQLTGPKSGTHTYFFTYTDHNINPDYTTLYNALSSFQVK
jgi:hypothetical protein